MDVLFKYSNYYSRKDSWCILKTKGHYRILERTPFCCKSGLGSIFWMYSDLVIAGEAISEGVDLMSSHIIKHFVCEGCWEWIVNRCIVELAQIDTDPDVSFCFLFLDDHGASPFALFYQLNDACC